MSRAPSRPRLWAAALAALALSLSGVFVPVARAESRAIVYVLDGAPIVASGAPVGLVPVEIEQMLAARNVDVRRGGADVIPDGTAVIVNPYGAAYPATDAVESALDDGTGWVNIGGVPFAMPDGEADASSPERHGIRTSSVPSIVVTGARPSELGRSVLPSWSPSGDDHGIAVHALRPEHERPLVEWMDEAFGPDADGDGTADDGGITAGPAVVLVTAPHRVVAAGFAGAASPLSPTSPGAADRLADLVRVATPTDHTISDVTIERDDSTVTVAATADKGRLEGTGVFAAPPRWSPSTPEQRYATLRLWRGRQLVDLVTLASNPALADTAGDQLTVNDTPYLLEGVASGQSTPPELDEAARASMLRADLWRMHDTGISAYRLYGAASDWLWNATARAGLLVVPAVGLGWVFGDSEAAALARVPEAKRLASDAATRHNVLMISVGNELMDPLHDRAERAIAVLADAVKDVNPTVLVTYGASHDEPWLLQEMPFLDVYSVNCYGASYPYGYTDPGFAHCIATAKQFAVDQPLALGEWGANTWQVDAANMYLRDQHDVFLQDLELARAEFVRQKWFTMMQLGAVGGFAFQWADGTDKCMFTEVHCQLTDPVVLPGDSSDYRIMNWERYWGFHDVWRNPRLALDALRDIYVNGNASPTGLAQLD